MATSCEVHCLAVRNTSFFGFVCPIAAWVAGTRVQEDFDPDYDPSEEDVLEYATFLGMDLEEDKDLFWLAVGCGGGGDDQRCSSGNMCSCTHIVERRVEGTTAP